MKGGLSSRAMDMSLANFMMLIGITYNRNVMYQFSEYDAPRCSDMDKSIHIVIPLLKRLFKIGILVRVNGCAAAEETDVRGGCDLVPSASGDEDSVVGFNRACFTIDLHEGFAFEYEIDLLTQLVVVPVCGTASWQTGFGEALLFDGRIGGIENTTDR